MAEFIDEVLHFTGQLFLIWNIGLYIIKTTGHYILFMKAWIIEFKLLKFNNTEPV